MTFNILDFPLAALLAPADTGGLPRTVTNQCEIGGGG